MTLTTGRMTTLGVRLKQPTVKSSTMKGTKVLGGKRRRRRCRNALERPSLMDKGALLGSTPRNRTGIGQEARAETMPLRERWTYSDWSSDVTVYAERPTNRGRTVAAGVMPGACLVRQVFETPQSGRVLQVGFRLGGQEPLWAKRCSWQGSRGSWLCYGWCRTYSQTKAVTCNSHALLMRPAAGRNACRRFPGGD